MQGDDDILTAATICCCIQEYMIVTPGACNYNLIIKGCDSPIQNYNPTYKNTQILGTLNNWCANCKQAIGFVNPLYLARYWRIHWYSLTSHVGSYRETAQEESIAVIARWSDFPCQPMLQVKYIVGGNWILKQWKQPGLIIHANCSSWGSYV